MATFWDLPDYEVNKLISEHKNRFFNVGILANFIENQSRAIRKQRHGNKAMLCHTEKSNGSIHLKVGMDHGDIKRISLDQLSQ